MMGKSNALRVASRRKYLHREAFVMVFYCPATPALGLDTVAGMHSGINFKTDKILMAVFHEQRFFRRCSSRRRNRA